MIKRFFTWAYNNSYTIICLVFLVFFLGLIFFGCVGTPAPAPTRDPILQPQVMIKVTNMTKQFYTVRIAKGDLWEDGLVVYPQESEFIPLELGTYEVCISKGFELEEKCVDKKVTEDDEWIIKKR